MGGKSHDEINAFSNECWPQLLSLGLFFRNLKKYISNIPYITTCCLGGFQEKLSSLIQKQTPANSVIRHDWNFKWHWLLWSDETEKRSFLANPPDEFSTNTDKKKYPMSTVKYTAVSLMLWARFSARGPEHLVQTHGIMDSIKYQQIKIWLPLLEILYWAVFGSSTRTTIQNKHQNKHKNGSLSTKLIFYHGCPCPLNWTSFPVAQMVEHGASNGKIMGSIPRESKSW